MQSLVGEHDRGQNLQQDRSLGMGGGLYVYIRGKKPSLDYRDRMYVLARGKQGKALCGGVTLGGGQGVVWVGGKTSSLHGLSQHPKPGADSSLSLA